MLDCGREVYVWKGKGATLDARMTGEGLGRDLAEQREGASVILVPQHTDDVLFRSQFVDTYAVHVLHLGVVVVVDLYLPG